MSIRRRLLLSIFLLFGLPAMQGCQFLAGAAAGAGATEVAEEIEDHDDHDD